MYSEKHDHHGHVLVLDDEKNIVTVLKAILEKRNFQVDGFTDPREALDSIRKTQYNAVITDLYMPEIDGMAFLEEVKRLYPNLPVVMITAFGTVDSAVDAIKRGAFDYVTKPFEQSEIVSVVQKAINTSKLKSLEFVQEEDDPLSVLTGKSFAIQEVQNVVKRVAPTSSSVLLLGEVGTGKEFLAEEVHRLSDRSFQPLIKVNCSAVPSMNLETEIFGGQKPGRLEIADKGSLFLDEISEFSGDLQLKLLIFLETGEYEHPLTGEKRRADVRLIAACHRDLNKEVKEGRLRSDLLYKLSVMPVQLPALKDRKEDIPSLINFFLKRLNKKLHKSITGVDQECLEIFMAASWPGNLRQLEHVLERMMLLSEGHLLRASAIPAELRSDIELPTTSENSRFREIVRRQTQNVEKELIEKALEEMDGNITRTAEHLGISRKGLQLKMKELGIKQLS